MRYTLNVFTHHTTLKRSHRIRNGVIFLIFILNKLNQAPIPTKNVIEIIVNRILNKIIP